MNRGEKVVESMPMEEVIRLLKKEVPVLERRMRRPRWKPPTNLSMPGMPRMMPTPFGSTGLGGWSIAACEPVEDTSEKQTDTRLYDTVCAFINMHDK
jgi:hypothetical protein